jgi:hypothetical protein
VPPLVDYYSVDGNLYRRDDGLERADLLQRRPLRGGRPDPANPPTNLAEIRGGRGYQGGGHHEHPFVWHGPWQVEF